MAHATPARGDLRDGPRLRWRDLRSCRGPVGGATRLVVTPLSRKRQHLELTETVVGVPMVREWGKWASSSSFDGGLAPRPSSCAWVCVQRVVVADREVGGLNHHADRCRRFQSPSNPARRKSRTSVQALPAGTDNAAGARRVGSS
jgi:hypothetical protein